MNRWNDSALARWFSASRARATRVDRMSRLRPAKAPLGTRAAAPRAPAEATRAAAAEVRPRELRARTQARADLKLEPEVRAQEPAEPMAARCPAVGALLPSTRVM